MKISAIIAVIIFAVLTVLNILIIGGLPLGEFTMGGKYKVLPKKMRIMGTFNLILQIVAILAILQTGNIMDIGMASGIARGICIFFAVYMLINAGMNFISFSKKEKYVMTPLAIISSICLWITVLL